MRRCTHCFHYSRGHPSYCSYCGRTYTVRLCPRGHVNARNAAFCGECGSDDLSTPAPPETWLSKITHWILVGFVTATVLIALFAVVAGIFTSIDWSQIAPHLVALVIMVGLLHWLSTLLPGPVKKVGKAAGKQAWKMIRGGHNDRRGRH